VKNLLVIARSEKRVEKLMVSINHLVHRVVSLLEERIATAGIALELDLYPEDLSIYMAESQGYQVLTNLIQNALEAMEESGVGDRIRVQTRPVGTRAVEIVVEDNGPGIPEDQRERVFEPFFTTKETGTGLGLAVVRSIVQENGGEIQVETPSEGGTRFRVIWPRNLEALQEEPSSEEHITQKEARSLSVVIVDDEVAILKLLERALSRKGYRVYPFQNPLEALHSLAIGPLPDVILLDDLMPEMTGREFYRRLGEKRPEALDRVVFVTGNIEERALEQIKATGRPYVSKPIQLAELFTLLSSVES